MRNAGADVGVGSNYYYTSNGKIATGSVAQTFFGTNADSKFTLSENAYIYGALNYNKASNFFAGAFFDEIGASQIIQVYMFYASNPTDGFRLYLSSGNISGTVAVYGLAKS